MKTLPTIFDDDVDDDITALTADFDDAGDPLEPYSALASDARHRDTDW